MVTGIKGKASLIEFAPMLCHGKALAQAIEPQVFETLPRRDIYLDHIPYSNCKNLATLAPALLGVAAATGKVDFSNSIVGAP